MGKIRKPFQGVYNIVRFNRHFYTMAIMVILILLWVSVYFSKVFMAGAFVVLLTTLNSLIVSWYVYDYSNLYTLDWLKVRNDKALSIVNINAGLDEISNTLKQRFPAAELKVFDFYDALPQKEISIQRAQKAYPDYVSTQRIALSALPLKNNSINVVCLFLAAHEIRNDNDRILFFKEINRVLHDDGIVIVVEHARDILNFLAYNVGFFHFLSLKKWLKTFAAAGFQYSSKQKITPFIHAFILQKDGASF